jgi:phosphoglycolate phosphatase-like HAD superfamily hydrolase
VYKTILSDIDGTLVEQVENYAEHQASGAKFKILPGVTDKLKEWEKKGYRLILITGRKESGRRITEKMLEELGIFYDQLIMGVGIGPRILINDIKPEKTDLVMAHAINVPRNQGIADLDL